ncbi:hypothetical protein BCR43DRAFT_459743 [Syncephalastrum racemosum]|uniref:RRM domain-containing protein n=1 Tax=Syncephalastrum racemosum TaxID=13706 RepID=A0A1X2HAW9_SYNRA|nr:hypothetical protein BCR43DRAFT_459743 [Syncephalastrum racemosum]
MSHSQQASRGSRVVFVGNIPFELTEEQLTDIFKEVGPVASFRLLFDRETKKPKGYGFCEYYDAETAASAVRNLNEYDIGGRQLRVDYAAMDPQVENARQQGRHHQARGPPPARPPPPMQQQQQMPPQHMPPPMAPPQQQPPPMAGVPNSSVDDISKVLASMNHNDLFELMSSMKQLSFEKPGFARQLLTEQPQVAYAIFQAMLMMNIVDPNIMARIMSNPPPNAAPSPMAAQPPQMPPQQPTPQPQQQHSPMPMQPPPQQVYQGTPPQQPPTMPSPQAPAGADAAQEQQKALLRQVLQLTDEQINALPPVHRDQIRQLKTQLVMQQQPTM